MVMSIVIIGDIKISMVRIIKASEFKAKCLKIMDEVAASGEPVVITKNGVPITQLIPARRRPQALFGALSSSVVIRGDILSPVDTRWEALQ
jgi:prevent-host-death family protein